MSENTFWQITERIDGLFDLSRRWADDDVEEPELKTYRQEGLSLREATKIADGDRAEYGCQIIWYDGPPKACRCGEAYAGHVLYVADLGSCPEHDHDILAGPICPGQLEDIRVYENGEDAARVDRDNKQARDEFLARQSHDTDSLLSCRRY